MLNKIFALFQNTGNKNKLIGLSEIKALSPSIENLDEYVVFLQTTQKFYNENQNQLDFFKYPSLNHEFGEIVTIMLDQSTLKLGNIWGLWTFSVSYWKTQKDEPKGNLGIAGLEKYNGYNIVLEQARERVMSIYDEIQSIDEWH
ncbi:MAG: hypothetical protein H7196_00505 [candidate division SR1 bacterium]|nr:hypothetical protein [candidate division SR1 bacterium]